MVISDNRAFFVAPRGSGMTTNFIDKMFRGISPTTERRIAIISKNASAFYFTLMYKIKELELSSYVEYKTQSSIKIWKNWIHIVDPRSFSNMRGYMFTDMYVQDYDEMDDYSKQNILQDLPIYSPEVLWIWGTKLNDQYINPLIKNGYKNYLLGHRLGMKFYHNFEEDTEELHKRMK